MSKPYRIYTGNVPKALAKHAEAVNASEELARGWEDCAATAERFDLEYRPDSCASAGGIF